MAELTVGLVSPGQMGAAVGGRLARHGVRVVTPAGRSAASRQRAEAAGIAVVPEAELADADYLFSIVPPGVALQTAERLCPSLREGGPVFVDWNAVSPARTATIAAIVTATGAAFVDGSILGLPGKLDAPGPLLLASGPDAPRLLPLAERGMRLAVMEQPVGAASALKMSYAGITKGLTALTATMLLAAHRAGCDAALMAELASSQPHLLERLRKSIPDMFSKAERWGPEMEEIADFIGRDRPESGIYLAMAALFTQLGADYAADGEEIRVLAGLAKPA